MDILDRLLQHDHWTTRQLLEQCRTLSPDAWDELFDIGHGTLRDTFSHMIVNVEVWTDLMVGQPVRGESRLSGALVDRMIARWEDAYSEFMDLAYQLAQDGRMDSLWLDTLDSPPRAKTYGGTISHVITHNMQHRGEIMHMLSRLGVPNVLEGDVLGWERQARERAARSQMSLLEAF